MIMGNQEFERRDSRKRRRLSERRRVFSRLGLGTTSTGSGRLEEQGSRLRGSMGSTDRSWSSSSHNNQERSDSPSSFFADQSQNQNKISMKIQFHITVAPENEPLILDASHLQQISPVSRQKSTDSSIGEQIHERLLSRQNTLSTRRRQQLLALHNQSATDGKQDQDQQQQQLTSTPQIPEHTSEQHSVASQFRSTPEGLAGSTIDASVGSSNTTNQSSGHPSLMTGREHGLRSSTITGGMTDEATMKFLANHHKQQQLLLSSPSLSFSSASHHQQQIPREHIYFKRDGQRFGHEFTLKLSVDRTYRCLLKVRPLISLQSISIQGHQTLFVDCSQTSSNASLAASSANSLFFPSPGSAPASSIGLNRSWQNIHQNTKQQQPSSPPIYPNSSHHQPTHTTVHSSNYRKGGRLLPHQQVSDSFLLYQQQQNQMMRHFAASHCSSTNPHLGGQLIYMFDWSASRFEVNKNKARTQVQIVLKFKNGQILSLPLQVKFYQPECKQHLSWGSQLHFIDYECSINNLGQMNVDKIQYY